MSNFIRSDGRSCSGSARSGTIGQWRCGSGDCMGKRSDCTMRQRNEDALEALEQAKQWLAEPEQRWENGWLATVGLPLLTIFDSPMAGRLQ